MTYGDIIPPSNPATKTLREFTATEPRPPFSLDKTPIIEGAREQDCREEETSGNIPQVDGPPAQQGQGGADRGITLFDGEPENNQRGEDTRSRDGADARANDGGGITAETGGWARGGRKIEGHHIDASKGDLIA